MSENMVQHFEQLYESMDTDKLIDLQRKGTLRPEAEEILNAVLEARGVTVVQRNRIVAELESTSRDDQVKHLAPIGDRIMARFIDTVICFALAATVGFIVLHLPEAAFHPAYLLLAPASFLGYLLLADSMASGQSFGKKWNGIAVVDKQTHEQCTAIQSLIRNFFIATLGIVDMALVLGDQGQRIGDRLAGTKVVKVEYLNRPNL
jgi:uncharacterized RDD family membrane protein YckC